MLLKGIQRQLYSPVGFWEVTVSDGPFTWVLQGLALALRVCFPLSHPQLFKLYPSW